MGGLTSSIVQFCFVAAGPLLPLPVDPLLGLPPGLLGSGEEEVAGQDQQEHGHQDPHPGQEHRPPVLLDLDEDVAQVAGDGAEHELQRPVRVHQLAFVEEVAVSGEVGAGEAYLARDVRDVVRDVDCDVVGGEQGGVEVKRGDAGPSEIAAQVAGFIGSGALTVAHTEDHVADCSIAHLPRRSSSNLEQCTQLLK